MLTVTTVPLLSRPRYPACRCWQVPTECSINLAITIHSTLAIWYSNHQLKQLLEPLLAVTPRKQPVWLALWTSIKSLKGSQTPKKQHLASVCPYLLLNSSKSGISGSLSPFAVQPLRGTSKLSTSGNQTQITL